MGPRSRRVTSGVVAALSSQAVLTVAQALLVPVFLTVWGVQRYGEWLTLSAAVAYASICDLGFSTYVVNRLGALRTRRHSEQYVQTLHSALAFSVRLASAVLAVLALGAFVLPLGRWFGFTTTSDLTASMVGLVLATQVLGSIPRGLLIGLYRTMGEYTRGVLVAAVERLTQLALVLAVLLSGGGLLQVALAQLLPLVGGALFVTLDLRRRHPDIVLGVSQRVPGLARSFVRPSLAFLAIQLSLVAVVQGSTLTISATLGAGAVAVFACSRTLANLVRQVSAALSNSLWPELTTISAWTSQRASLIGLHRMMVKCLWGFALAAAFFLYLAGEDVFLIWTDGQLEFDAWLFDAMLLHLVVQAPWMASSYVLLASNQHTELAWRQGLAAALGLACGVWFVPSLGAVGLILGLGASELLLCAAFVPRSVCRKIGDSWGSFARDVFGRAGLVALFVIVLAVATDGWLSMASPEVRIACAALIAGLVTPLLSWRIALTATERERLRPWRKAATTELARGGGASQ